MVVIDMTRVFGTRRAIGMRRVFGMTRVIDMRRRRQPVSVDTQSMSRYLLMDSRPQSSTKVYKVVLDTER